jgi:AcrR family transcriptional regulator
MVQKKVALKAREMRGELYASAVLTAAEEEFATHGFANARMQRVAQRAGLSVGSIYKLFDSKDALYAAIHKLRGPALLERMKAVFAQGGSAPALVRAAIHEHVAFCVEHPSYLRLQLMRGIAWGTGSGEFTKGEQRDYQRLLKTACAFFEQGIARGELVSEDPKLIATALMAVQQAYLQRWLDDGMREPAASVADRVAALFERMYANKGRRLAP